MTHVDTRLAGKEVPRISREQMERGHVARASGLSVDDDGTCWSKNPRHSFFHPRMLACTMNKKRSCRPL